MIYSQLRAFLAAAQAGTFSKGAKTLGITQPSISKQIRELEERCGEPLFERVGREVRLTPLGRKMVSIAKRMIDAELDGLQLLSDVKALVAGDLRIAAVGPYHLMEILSAFHKQFARIRITVSFGDSCYVERAVRGFDAEIGILATKGAIPECEALCYRSCRILLQVPADHPLAGKSVVQLQDLKGETFISREPGSSTRQIFEAMLQAAGVPMHSVLELGSREAIRIAVANGLGLAYVSEDEVVPHSDIRVLPIADASQRTNASVIWRKERGSNTVIRAFLDTARALARG